MAGEISSTWQDLSRRRVFKVGAIYAAAAWLLVQVASEVVPALFLPAWVMTAIVVMAALGFPVAVLLGWVFDIGPNGVARTRPGSAKGLVYVSVSLGLLVAATAAFVVSIVPEPTTQNDDLYAGEFSPIANSIAVLPFVNLASGPGTEFIGEGISEILIHQLSQIRELHVIARTSASAFRNQQIDVRAIGRRLNVSHVLEGSVQRSGDELRITAQLINAVDGSQIWSRLFDRSKQDLFDIQDEISLAVATEIVEQIPDDELNRATRNITDNMDAHDLYILGRHHVIELKGVGSFQKPIDYFEEAIELDPNFALAWSGLSDAYILHAIGGGMTMAGALEKSRKAIDLALSLDPDLAEAHGSNLFHALITGDFEAGQASFQRATELSPSYWLPYLWYGHMLYGQFRVADALEVYSTGLQFEPLAPLLKGPVSAIAMNLGDYEKGMALAVEIYLEQSSPELAEQYLQNLMWSALTHNRFDEVIGFAQAAIERGDDSETPAMLLAYAHIAIGNEVEARIWIDKATEISLGNRQRRDAVNNFDLFVDWMRAYLYRVLEDTASLNALAADASAVAEGEPMYGQVASLAHLFLGNNRAAADYMALSLPKFADSENYIISAFAYSQLGPEFKDQADSSYSEGLQIVNQGLRENLREPDFLGDVAAYRAIEGSTQKVIDALEAAYEAGYRDDVKLNVLPIFDTVRDEPRFSALVKRIQDDVAVMRERVIVARESGDWESLTGFDLGLKQGSR